VDYPGKPGALSEVELELRAGETLGLVGQSGSGKSTIALAILRLLEMRGGRARGSILFQGRDLMSCTERELRRLRGSAMSLVPQSPVSALNPALRLETHLREAWRAHAASPWSAARPGVQGLLRQMDIPADDAFLRRYPHQVSVGQAQRVVLAMAMMHRPALLIADEPTSALDAVSQAGILDLLRWLNRDFGTAILYISHDLSSVASICDRVAVLNAGRVVECGPTGELFEAPAHPFTRLLVGQAGKEPSAKYRRQKDSSEEPAAETAGVTGL
jgi:ABC-type dipeptide/oligopeptide/nickel transport system ATPase component